jgi:hypothetical protein
MKYCFLIFLCTLMTPLFSETPNIAPLQSAMKAYDEAQKNPQDREKLLNEALKTYLTYETKNASPELLANVGDIYFYLGDFGMAIAYYRRAEYLLPRDPTIQKNLSLALHSANVTGLQIERPLADAAGLLFLSPYEKQLFLLGALSLTFILFSLNLWLPSFGFKRIFQLVSVLTSLLFIAVFWYSVFLPPRAVVVKACPLKMTSQVSSQNDVVTSVRPGEMVEIVTIDPSHVWVQVRTVTQSVGYISWDAIREIS